MSETTTRTIHSPFLDVPKTFDFSEGVPREEQDRQIMEHMATLHALDTAQKRGPIAGLASFLSKASQLIPANQQEVAPVRELGPRVIRASSAWGLTPEQINQTAQTLSQREMSQAEIELQREEQMARRKAELARMNQELTMKEAEHAYNMKLKGMEHTQKLDEIQREHELKAQLESQKEDPWKHAQLVPTYAADGKTVVYQWVKPGEDGVGPVAAPRPVDKSKSEHEQVTEDQRYLEIGNAAFSRAVNIAKSFTKEDGTPLDPADIIGWADEQANNAINGKLDGTTPPNWKMKPGAAPALVQDASGKLVHKEEGVQTGVDVQKQQQYERDRDAYNAAKHEFENVQKEEGQLQKFPRGLKSRDDETPENYTPEYKAWKKRYDDAYKELESRTKTMREKHWPQGEGETTVSTGTVIPNASPVAPPKAGQDVHVEGVGTITIVDDEPTN